MVYSQYELYYTFCGFVIEELINIQGTIRRSANLFYSIPNALTCMQFLGDFLIFVPFEKIEFYQLCYIF